MMIQALLIPHFLLNVNIVIAPWVVMATKSVYDLDNIKLSSLKPADKLTTGVDATFQLKNILVQAHVRDSQTGGPPRGLQFVLGALGNSDEETYVDTITMANLGYFQLKANAGVWALRIRRGRSADIYEFESAFSSMHDVSGSSSHDGKGDVVGEMSTVVLDNFEGVTMYPKVRRKAGMESEDVLEPEVDSSSSNGGSGGVWGSIKTGLLKGLGFDVKPKNETINIFSVASGHLYERFLAIMMNSVMKKASAPVKFWLIEDFLSPSFKVGGKGEEWAKDANVEWLLVCSKPLAQVLSQNAVRESRWRAANPTL